MTLDRWRVPQGPGTHLLMNGGILSVPHEETREFHEAYIHEIQSGNKLYVIELKTEKFKFFIDFDYVKPEKLSNEALEQFCSILCESVKGRCCIARARPRPVTDGIKSGVHVIFPDVIVNRMQALQLRTTIIDALGPGNWSTIIDASVYAGSGFRMLWSNKKPTGDPYIPWKILGSPELSKEPNVEILELFCIRTNIEASISNLRETLESTNELEQYIRKYIAGQERTSIKKLQRNEHDGWFAQTDSKYCEMIKREHKSNHIWFSIKGGKISQRCFDGECSEFKGRENNLPPTIIEQLNHVDIVGSPSSCVLLDFLPNGSSSSLQEVRETCASLLGPGPRELESLFEKPSFIRTVGFNPN